MSLTKISGACNIVIFASGTSSYIDMSGAGVVGARIVGAGVGA